MKIGKIISLILGIGGFIMIFSSIAQGTITGAVIGANATSRTIGVFGILLMIIAIVVERYEFKHEKRK